jgi:molybdopterin-guanine dinucleotide biosynthesis protein A
MPDHHCLAAAILAGGRARRLGGADKSALTIDGETILARTVRVLRDLTPLVFVVGDTHGAAAAAGLPVRTDLRPDSGALGGIYTAIETSPCDRTLVVGCDMPFLSERFLKHLAEYRDADVVMPRSASGYEPLCAIYGRAAAPGILARLERGALKAARPPENVRVVEIGPEEVAAFDPHGLLFVNVNTPHDYERARRLSQG